MKWYGRALLKEVEGYAPGEQPKGSDVIKLNTNENPYPPAPPVLEAIKKLDDSSLRKYPDPMAEALRDACAKRYGMPGADWVVVGNGMDELLAMVLRAFVDPGEDVLTVYPTYTLYDVLCRIHGCNLRYVNLNDDFLPPDSFYSEEAKLCFLTRPNAPTGVAWPRDNVQRFCEGFDGIVVIDEAYADFGDDNCMDFPSRFENVIAMRSFSKSFSMAGVRIGTAAAQPALINEFLKIKDSYN
ncbi:MAG TPA: aminotransferase class I/II-fold pyridoxal phosphate-dependent enzyme, partial [Candidatus Hydrogenedentes bacterium]|nr:aminotransferase class I/II-fold pyridoxal phosphate-dependent enzyme [Candidatus Hydrogenedentota bacterium]